MSQPLYYPGMSSEWWWAAACVMPMLRMPPARTTPRLTRGCIRQSGVWPRLLLHHLCVQPPPNNASTHSVILGGDNFYFESFWSVTNPSLSQTCSYGHLDWIKFRSGRRNNVLCIKYVRVLIIFRKYFNLQNDGYISCSNY